jgi:hypothetical protein
MTKAPKLESNALMLNLDGRFIAFPMSCDAADQVVAITRES